MNHDVSWLARLGIDQGLLTRPQALQIADKLGHGADLMAFAQQFGLAAEGAPARRDLETMLVATKSLLDVTQWRERLGRLEGRVCRVEFGGQPAGTGFLLGSDIAITNYHVLEPVIKQQGWTPADVRRRPFSISRSSTKVRAASSSPDRLGLVASPFFAMHGPMKTVFRAGP